MRLSRFTPIARRLRTDSTEAERLLWHHLRAERLEGVKFRRQQPIGIYIVDFVCFEKKVIIEVDGGQHATQAREDSLRDDFLNQQGYKVLRFWNNDVLGNISGVLQTVRSNL